MLYAVAMNGDNPDTRIIEKIGEFLQISFLAYKIHGLNVRYRDSNFS